MKKMKKAMAVAAIAAMTTTMIPFNVLAALPVAVSASSIASTVLATNVTLSGADRYETAAKIALEFGTSDNAILTAGMNENLVDALTAAPLAKVNNAPILLTEGDKLTAATKSALGTLGVKKVFVTSGAVGQKVLDELTAMGIQSEQLGGKDRFQTAINIAKKIGATDKVVIARADNNADALSIAAIAAAKGMPILLSYGDQLQPDVANYLNSVKSVITQSYILGGTGVLSDSVKSALPNAKRLAGADRFGTNQAVLNEFSDIKYDKVFVANGLDEHLVDALAGSALAAKTLSPIVLVNDQLPSATKSLLATKVARSTTVTTLGGVVPNQVADQISSLAAAATLYKVGVTAKDSVLKADGGSNTILTFELKDSAGKLLTNANNVEVYFTTTYGNLGAQRVTVQNGIATVVLTSEFSTTDVVASITAVVVEAQDKEMIGLKAETTVAMSPNPNQAQVGQKPVLVSSEANQADRVVVYFDRNIDLSYFVDKDGHFNDGINFEVRSIVDNDGFGGTVSPVVGVMPVDGNSKALTLILSKAPVLFDNSNITVKLSDSTGTISQESKAPMFKLTDARQPAMLSVASKDPRTLEVVFSESIADASATNENNWSIDGVALDPAKYDISVGDFVNGTNGGADKRSIVTIKNLEGFFTAGDHSIQAAKIGDWASVSDFHNEAATQTLDFNIKLDSTVPAAVLTEQSPEQWLLDFNIAVTEGAAQAAAKLQMEKNNVTAGTWDPSNFNFIADANQYTIGQPNVLVTKIGDDKFLLELMDDWTNIYDTANSHKNFFNDQYHLVLVDKGFTSANSGKQSAKQTLALDGTVMKADDVTSPVIQSLKEVTKGKEYKAVLSEPVKVINSDITLMNNEGPTVGQGQLMPVVATAKFITKDGSKTIQGLVKAFADEYDQELTIVPVEELSAGEWTLSVQSIADDLGNTAATLTQTFTVAATPTQEVGFRVEFAFADVDKDLVVEKQDFNDEDGQYDYVFVKFTKPVSLTGDIVNALKTTNYTLNGMELPQGTQIFANIAGFDDKDQVTDSITIRIPQGVVLGGLNSPNVLKVSKYLKAADGTAITGDTEITLEYNVAEGPLVPFVQ